MAIYEMIKDCISAAQKADNIPLVQKLIETQVQILDLINENDVLKRENKELKNKEIQFQDIERHSDAYITLKSDKENIIYCSCCFDKEHKLVQVQVDEEYGTYHCPACKYNGFFDKKKYNDTCNIDTSDNIIF